MVIFTYSSCNGQFTFLNHIMSNSTKYMSQQLWAKIYAKIFFDHLVQIYKIWTSIVNEKFNFF